MTTSRQTNQLVTIGEVVRTVGVATPTLRYDEQEGPLAPMTRSPAGYRLYDAHAVQQLRFIRAAQAVGFTLDDIRALGRLAAESGRNCRAEVRRLLDQRPAG